MTVSPEQARRRDYGMYIVPNTRTQEAPTHMAPDLGPCLIWTGSLWNGYGVVYNRSRQLLAHRAAHSWFNGTAIPGTKVCIRHRCDVKNCVSPHHLVPGTLADNNVDAYERGLMKRGAARSKHGWTDADVLGWRERVYVDGEAVMTLFREYLATDRPVCSESYFRETVKGAVWHHLAMPKGVKHAPPKKPRKPRRRARKL